MTYCLIINRLLGNKEKKIDDLGWFQSSSLRQLETFWGLLLATINVFGTISVIFRAAWKHWLYTRWIKLPIAHILVTFLFLPATFPWEFESKSLPHLKSFLGWFEGKLSHVHTCALFNFHIPFRVQLSTPSTWGMLQMNLWPH